MRTGISWLDIKLGLRMLVKYPALTLVGGLGMAVSIAVSVGFFAFMAVHVHPTIPLEDGDRIVALENRDVTVNDEERRSLHDFVVWRDELRAVRDLGAFRTVPRNLLARDGTPEPVRVAEMTASGFRVARVPPLLGRYLVAEDERAGAPPVLVIGHDVWQRRFAGDRAVVGREVRLGATAHTVVGVMPEGFAFPESDQYWTPLRADPATFPRRTGPEIYIFGRLAPGATIEQAQTELAAIGRRTAAEFPKSNAKLQPMVMPYTHSLTDIQGTTTWMVVQIQLMMTLLLVVVALNVAVLVYARTAMRQGEIAVRTALGASRRRLVAQLFTEALVLSLCAAAVGLALAQVGVRLGNQIAAAEMGSVPFWTNYSLQPATVLFTVGIAVLAAVIVGVLPGLQATGRSLEANLRQLGGGTGIRLGRTWTVLIVAQVAIAVAALPAAGAIAWGQIRGASTRPTYRPEEFLSASLRAEPAAYGSGAADPRADSARFSARLTELMTRLAAEPAVAGVTYWASLPGRWGRVEVEGVPAPAESPTGHHVASNGVAPSFVDVYGARVLTGRGFEPADTDSTATAVLVNRTFARQVLGGASALGRRVRYASPPARADSAPRPPSRWYEIVGVIEDLHVNELAPDLVRPSLYYAVAPGRAQELSLEVRVRGASPADFAPRLRAITAAVDPTLQLGAMHTMVDKERREQVSTRLVGLVIGLVLASVFLLSAAGVYALTSFTVTQRRREIGIRTALGAHPRQVLRTVFARVARQLALGLALGIGIGALAERLSGGELMGGHAGILVPTFGAAMAVVALLAAFGPARRGLRIQPTEALRGDT